MEVVSLCLGPTLISCVSTISTLSTCFLGFDIPTFSFVFIETYFIILVIQRDVQLFIPWSH